MYCKNCLAANAPEATKCAQCGSSLSDAIAGAGAAASPVGAPEPAEFVLQEPDHTHSSASPNAPQGGPVDAPVGAPIGGPIGGPEPTEEEKKKKDIPIPPMPPDHKNLGIGVLAGSTLTLLCGCFNLCCGCGAVLGMIAGLLSLLESGKIKGLHEDGNYELAEAASKRAKLYAMIGIGAVLVMGLMSFVFVLIRFGMGAFNVFGNRGNV